jgi:transcription initiation factor TFIID TATA-box-binding protein
MPEQEEKAMSEEEEEKEENEEGEGDEEEKTEPDLDYKIENVVATVTVDIKEKIDLNILARKYADVEYNPERFPGLVMRIAKPKATILVFSTGKMVVTGMRKASEAKSVVEHVIQKIRKAKIDVSNPTITVQNIVASGDLHTSIDLNMAAVVMEYAMYEPEVFPGLIYRMQDPKTVFLIFSTGRIVCTGGKTKEIVARAVRKLLQEVKEYGVAKAEGEEFDDSTFI